MTLDFKISQINRQNIQKNKYVLQAILDKLDVKFVSFKITFMSLNKCQMIEDNVISGGVNISDGGVNGGVFSDDILLDTIANNRGLNTLKLAEILGKSL